ncbi:MAG: HEAT repeat domain-containing protein [Acidobacteria bacterium]|nr:HEAT repeat domain-containing protein [Acidobacteriota bacterium]
MNCETARQQIVLLIYGELSFEEEEILESHLDACVECNQERARLEKLSSFADLAESEVPAGLLARCRRDLTAALEQERRRPSLSSIFRGFWQKWFVNPPMWMRPAGALAMLAVGFFGARLLPDQSSALSQIGVSQGPPPTISKVRLVNPDNSGQVLVHYDEVRPRELRGNINDDRIRRLLLAAAADPADPGLRVDSIDILKSQTSDNEVRHALLNVLRADTNSGVRLKALDALRPYAKDPDTRKTLAQVLLSDDNPAVRTQAIDLLVQSKEPDVAGVLQQLLQNEENGYVRSRSQKALNDMKASVGTF